MINQTAKLKTLFWGSVSYFSQSLSSELSYRFSLIQQLMGACVGLLGLVFFWRTAGSSISSQISYTPTMLTTYLTLAYLLPLLQDHTIGQNIASAIRLGKLSFYLLRPYPYLMGIASQAFAVACLRGFFFLPLAFLSFQFFDELALPSGAFSLQMLFSFITSIVLAIFANILLRTIFGLLAFDLTQTWGPELVFLSFYTLASGEVYPIDLLPSFWMNLASWTPVFYMAGFPALILLGRLDPTQINTLFLRGCLVTFLTGCIAMLLWRRGLKHYEAVGS